LGKLPLFALFLILAISIFGVPLLLSDTIELIYRVALCIVLLACALRLRKNTHLSPYFPAIFAFFVASLVYTFEYALYSSQSLLYWVSASRMDLFVLFKVLSTVLVVLPVIVLTKASGQNMASIYLSKGKLRLGLTVGMALFLLFLVTSVWTGTLLYGGKT
jgi:hypothetical protein